MATGFRGKSSLWVIKIIIYRFESKNKSQVEVCVCVFNRLFKKTILVHSTLISHITSLAPLHA